MGHFASWTPQDVADKADSEGGVSGILGWGGPEVFECFGEEALRLARIVYDGLNALSDMMPEPGDGEW